MGSSLIKYHQTKIELQMRVTIIILTLVISNSLFSQGRSYMDYTFGGSFAIGDFSSQNINQSDAGFATGGFASCLTIGYQVKDEKFGLLAKVQSQSNFFKSDAYANGLANLVSNSNWSIYSTFYSTNSYLIGLSYHSAINSKVSINLHSMFGMMISESPEIRMYENTIPGWLLQLSDVSISTGIELGGGLKSKINGRTSLQINFDYLYTKPEFTDVPIYSSDGEVSWTTFTQPINTLNITVGVSYDVFR